MEEFFNIFLEDCKDENIDLPEFRNGYIPYSIERISDGSILYLNEDNQTYSLEDGKNGCKWTWGRLFMDSRCTGEFKVIGWVKLSNIESMHKFMRDKKLE